MEKQSHTCQRCKNDDDEELVVCKECKKHICDDCHIDCEECNENTCLNCAGRCANYHSCDNTYKCNSCSILCLCGNKLCLDCGNRVTNEGCTEGFCTGLCDDCVGEGCDGCDEMMCPKCKTEFQCLYCEDAYCVKCRAGEGCDKMILITDTGEKVCLNCEDELKDCACGIKLLKEKGYSACLKCRISSRIHSTSMSKDCTIQFTK